jgi:hypothetical protein
MNAEDRVLPHGAPCAPEQARTIPYLVAFAVIYLAALLVLRFVPMPKAGQIAVALAPVPFFGFYILRWVRAIRALDELQRLITLEALAIAFPLSLLLILTLGLLQAVDAFDINRFDYLKLWPMVFWFYFIGLFVARKRYR